MNMKMNVKVLVMLTVLVVMLLILLLWWTHDITKHRGRRFIDADHQENQEHEKLYGNVYKLNDTISEEFNCMVMPTDPPTNICIYPPDVDYDISRYIKEHGMWKPEIVSALQEWLQEDSQLGFIDIGSHIGVFTLTAAAMGHSVVAVEPMLDSNKRLHKAAQMSGLQNKIVLLQNAVSNTRNQAALVFDEANRDHATIKDMGNHTGKTDGVDITNTILLDDVMDHCEFGKAILKINIEGQEHKAMYYGQALLETLDVWIVMMNWEWMSAMLTREVHYSEDDHRLLMNLTKDLYELDYEPRSYETRQLLKIKEWKNWPKDIYWERIPYEYDHNEF